MLAVHEKLMLKEQPLCGSLKMSETLWLNCYNNLCFFLPFSLLSLSNKLAEHLPLKESKLGAAMVVKTTPMEPCHYSIQDRSFVVALI